MRATLSETVLDAMVCCSCSDYDQAPVNSLVQHLDHHLKNQQWKSSYLLLHPAYEDGTLAGICAAMEKNSSTVLGTWFPCAPYEELYEGMLALMLELRTVVREELRDPDLISCLARFHEGLVGHQQLRLAPSLA